VPSRLPLVPLTAESAQHLGLSALHALLPASCEQIVRRAPELADPARWREQRIGGRDYSVAQPVTFTPYAATRPCSARCRFCSENLRSRHSAVAAALQRPGPDYFAQLGLALAQLEGLPLSYSLSGLETTDDPDFMCALLDGLDRHAGRSPVEQRVLYTNGAGLAGPAQARLIARLARFGLDWIELSRHHHQADRNQAIMRFREGSAQRDAAGFDAMLEKLTRDLAVKLVCIAQRGGIESAEGLRDYLEWARARGVRSVILRELSKLDPSYVVNGTARHIENTRVGAAALLRDSLRLLGDQFAPHSVTAGYYFWNVIGRYRGLELIFEASDYAVMHAQHDTARVYKLVFHANGALCAGWDPDRHVLFDARPRDAREVCRGG
jgi:hypothetical protein